MNAAIDITSEQRKILMALLRKYISGVAVWAYGSRVKWTTRPSSDLDLVVFTSPNQVILVSELKNAIAESDLPFLVDLHVWDEIPERFREIIRKEYVVVQEQREESDKSGVRSHSPLEHPSDWPVVRLADITLKIGSGATPRGGAENYLPERTNFALIRSQNVFDRHFDCSGLAFISDEQAHELRNVIVQSGDLLLNITGDGVTFSRCCAVPDDVLPACVNQHVSIIRIDPAHADPGYILAFLTHPIVKKYIESFNAGGSRRAITKGHIESFKLPLPPIGVQHSLAHILGTLDDKIELNRKTNETLEAMARTLFKSWFVDFDPVRAKAEGRETGLPDHLAALFPDSFEDSELGDIPSSWSVKNLGDLIELAYGKALKAEDRRHGNVTVFGSNGQIGWHDENLVDGPGIIVGRKGNPGIVTWAPTDFFAIDTAFYVVAKTECNSLYFLFHTLKLHDLASLGADSAVPGLNRNMAYLSKQLVPSPTVLEAFDQYVRPLFERVQRGKEEASSLAQIRDALLPKLISGEIRIESNSSMQENTL